MNYVGIINFIFSGIFAFLGILIFHFIIFAIIGIFKKRSYPETEEKLKYAIIIPARNEERVVANLIESIQKSNYPRELLHIFLVAHNCTDRTAEIGRSMGVSVYEYDNPGECTMGYAFKYLFHCIERDYSCKTFDGFFLFNADNIVEPDYFDKMNDAFVFENKSSVITSFRNSKNFGENVISAMYGLYFIYGCRFEARGRAAVGCSTRVQGTGYLISSDIVKNGWNYVTLTEDWEFTADQLLKGRKIVYCDDAVFYDEQPTSIPVMWRQRVRWAKGHLLVFLSRYKDLIRSMFKKKDPTARTSLYDLSVNILPVGIIGVGVTLAHFIALLFSPIFGERELVSVIIGFFRAYRLSFLYSYISIVFSSIIICIIERKRIPKTKATVLFSAILLWPLFILLAAPCDIAALFSKKIEWKEIPHKSTTTINDLKKFKR